MTTPAEYVLQLKAKLTISPIVASFNLVEVNNHVQILA